MSDQALGWTFQLTQARGSDSARGLGLGLESTRTVVQPIEPPRWQRQQSGDCGG
ncbi:MAG: hypothetical protein HC929_21915 [Leptolyngbyaceae cyanobacterium SM2_5_2]|nr:hypothetical protein [Leptolyngbyaceae cyanobacterium SM2_5_2]